VNASKPPMFSTSPTVPPVCPERPRTVRLVRARETDDLSRDDRRLLLDHLSGCGECRSTAVSLDSTLFFAPMAGPATDVTDSEGRKMASDVLAVLEGQRIDRRIRRPRRSILNSPVLKVAALLLLGAGLAGLISLHPWGGDAKAPARVATVMEGTAATKVHAVPAAASAPLIETVDSPGVKVYQFSADAPGQPAVVFVVDRNSDL
jgi:hypothetical protein